MSEALKARAQEIVKLAKERKMTFATVESCTAGRLAHLLSQAEGASDVLHGGFIVYTKENKTRRRRRAGSAARKAYGGKRRGRARLWP